jgi:hypothetical protein
MTTLNKFKEQTTLVAFAEGDSQVNKEKGEIRGVSIMTTGEAKGHGMFIDDQTLQELFDILNGDAIPAYITHDGAIWGDRVTSEVGIFSGFYREGDKVKGTFKAFDSFREHEKKTYDRLFEVAEKIPGKFGTSIVFNLQLEWELDDGSKMRSYNEPENAVNGPFVRPLKVASVDFVDSPASNNGLFNQNNNPDTDNMKKTDEEPKPVTFSEEEHNTALGAKDTEIVTLNEKITEIESEKATLSEAKDALQEEVTSLSAKLGDAEKATEEKQKELASIHEENEKIKKENEIYQKIFSGSNPVLEPKDPNEGKPAKQIKEEMLAEIMDNEGCNLQLAIVKLSKVHPELFTQ